MAPDKVTVMILDVDLQCLPCYKEVKKLLCKFPQIRDQVFDEEKNKVRITVVCCNPEKLRDKLCCKGGKAIQRIEIVEDKQPFNKNKEVPSPEPTDSPRPPPPPPPPPPPMCGYPPPAFPVSACCPDCYQGRSGGPCEYLYGRPPTGPCYDGYGYAGNRACYSSRCDYYFNEENPQGCWIM